MVKGLNIHCFVFDFSSLSLLNVSKLGTTLFFLNCVQVDGEGDTGVITTKHLGEFVALLEVASLYQPQSSFRVSELFLKLDCKLPEGSNQVIIAFVFPKVLDT